MTITATHTDTQDTDIPVTSLWGLEKLAQATRDKLAKQAACTHTWFYPVPSTEPANCCTTCGKTEHPENFNRNLFGVDCGVYMY